MCRTIGILIFLSVCLCGTAVADQVQFTNGDRLTGKVRQIKGGWVEFNSRNLGTVSIDAAKVRSLTSERLVFVNGDTLSGKMVSMSGGTMLFESDLAGSLTIDLSKLAAFNVGDALPGPAERESDQQSSGPNEPSEQKENTQPESSDEARPEPQTDPPAESKSDTEKSVLPNWAGKISVGLTSTHGNTSRESYNFGAEAARRSEKDRWTFNADFARSEQKSKVSGKDEVTEHWWKTRGKYDYFLNKKLYVFGDGRLEKDAIARLDRRIVVGGGAGYQWLESDKTNFRTEGGLASVYEKFEDQTDSQSDVSAQFGYHFDTKIKDKIVFLHDLTYYPSLEKVSDYFLTATGEIRAPVTERFFVNFKVIFDYDTTPAMTAQSTDIKYILGLGYEF